MMRQQHILRCATVLATIQIASLANPDVNASWSTRINRSQIVQSFNPHRTSISSANSSSTPMQVGNGDFAFGVDVTGMQTIHPFNTLASASWAWHNMSLPTTPGQTSPEDFTGVDWWTHGRLVNYNQPNPAEADISNWMIRNPQRVNLGRVGLWFAGTDSDGDSGDDWGRNVTESDISGISQVLDLYSGRIASKFMYNGTQVDVQTYADPDSETVAFQIDSGLLGGELGVFLDYPYADVNKFDAPFVGDFGAVSKHTTSLVQQSPSWAVIRHDMGATTYFTSLKWDSAALVVVGPLPGTHRYILRSQHNSSSESRPSLNLSVNFGPSPRKLDSTSVVAAASAAWWKSYWENGAFVDLTRTNNETAVELQRRIILSQYLLAVNGAGRDPPQESGLTNIGWYGKFHLEMYPWHSLHWLLWGRDNLLERSISVYNRFLSSSTQRAAAQGYKGARWGKMSDPTGRSAPGEINSLLIWQQPHPLLFAEYDYRAHPNKKTLKRWDGVLTATADFMASYAFWNESSGVYDLGPPMYPVSENTNPNATRNPTFELAYWRFGLDIAVQWKERLGQEIPSAWEDVRGKLALLPVADGGYGIYEGTPGMWTDPETTNDHPAMIGVYGLLPPTPGLNISTVRTTAEKVWSAWDFPYSYGWDFPMLAMNAARLGEVERAVGFLVAENFEFDDVGMPVGGERVATPYFPSSGGLLWTVAMMVSGWDGSAELVKRWPVGWTVQAEGFSTML